MTTTLTLGRDYLKSALFLAHASRAAYEDDPKNYSDFRLLRLDTVRTFASAKTKDNEATRCFIAENEEAIVLAFRGTDMNEGALQDWAINLNFLQVPYKGAKVHSGFYQALTSVWAPIRLHLLEIQKNKSRKIWITGHSLGGALATLATLHIQEMWQHEFKDVPIKQIETHTFGQPRVGDKAMCRQIVSAFYRFAYASDPVAYIPFKVPRAMDYTHAGTLKQIDVHGRVYDDASNWLARLLAGCKTIMKMSKDLFDNNPKAFASERIKDHLLPNYVDKLEMAIRQSAVKTK